MNRDDLATAILEHLNVSYGVVVKAKTLRDTIGISGGTLRVLINELRCQGWPICSCREGYYLTWSTAKIKQTIKNLRGRQIKMQYAIDGLKKLIVPQVEEGGEE